MASYTLSGAFLSVTRQDHAPHPAQVDPNNPPWPAYRGYHEYSFAYATMGKRLPTILGKAIDDVVRTLNEQSDEDVILDLVACLGTPIFFLVCHILQLMP